jgi:MoxR-like ATPase
VRDYALRLVRATREHPDLALGASPRGSLALVRAAQAWAATQGRDYVLPDDVKRLAPATLAHRLILRSESQLRGRTTEQIVRSVLEHAPVPLVDERVRR